jgi:hypothetical protein
VSRSGHSAPRATGILGGGFGLYGWLPALRQSGARVIVLPARYQPIIASRAELAPLLPALTFVADEASVLAGADRLVIARRPGDQAALVAAALRVGRVRELVLEKPLAPTPDAAAALLAAIPAAGLAIRVGWSVAMTGWARALAAALAARSPVDVAIAWRFRAHHFRAGLATWKRRHADGGGALRFYGTQLLAVLARSDVRLEPEWSRLHSGADGEPARWTASLRIDGGHGLSHRVRLLVDSDAEAESFALTGTGVTPVWRRDPFDARDAVWTPDRRVDRLAELLAEPARPALRAWHERVVAAWGAVERLSGPSVTPPCAASVTTGQERLQLTSGVV